MPKLAIDLVWIGSLQDPLSRLGYSKERVLIKVKIDVSRGREDLRFDLAGCYGIGKNGSLFVIWRKVHVDRQFHLSRGLVKVVRLKHWRDRALYETSSPFIVQNYWEGNSETVKEGKPIGWVGASL